MKKLFLGIGVLASVTAPVVLAISCGDETTKPQDTQDQGSTPNFVEKDGVKITFDGTTVTNIEVDGTVITTMTDLMTKVGALATEKGLEAPQNPLSLVTVTGNPSLQAMVDAGENANNQNNNHENDNENVEDNSFSQSDVESSITQSSLNVANVTITDTELAALTDNQEIDATLAAKLGLSGLQDTFTYTISNIQVTEGIDTAHNDTVTFTVTTSTKGQTPTLTATDTFTNVQIASFGSAAVAVSDQELADQEQTRIAGMTLTGVTARDTDLSGITSPTVLTEELATKLGFTGDNSLKFDEGYTYEISNVVVTDGTIANFQTGRMSMSGDSWNYQNFLNKDTISFNLVASHNTKAQRTNSFNMSLSSRATLTKKIVGRQMTYMLNQTDDTFFNQAHKVQTTLHDVENEFLNHQEGRIVSELITNTNNAIFYVSFPNDFGVATEDVIEEIKTTVGNMSSFDGQGNSDAIFNIDNKPDGWYIGATGLETNPETHLVMTIEIDKNVSGFNLQDGWWAHGLVQDRKQAPEYLFSIASELQK